MSVGGRHLGGDALRPGCQNQGTQRATIAAGGHRGLRVRARLVVGLQHKSSGAARAHLIDEALELVGQCVERGQLGAIAWRQDNRRGKGGEHDIHDARLTAAYEPRAPSGELDLHNIAGFADLPWRRRDELGGDLVPSSHQPAPQRIKQVDESPLPKRSAIHDHRIEHQFERKQLSVDMAEDRPTEEVEQPVNQGAIGGALVIILAIQALAGT